MFAYKIPDEIKNKIPESLYSAFLDELVHIFGDVIFENEYDDLMLIHYEGTCGWNKALRKACIKTNQTWLYDYYEKLPWYDSDLFDSELSDEVIQKIKNNKYYSNFILNGGTTQNDY